MSSLRTVVETLIKLVQAEILPGAELVPADDVFEIKKTPSLILQGPTLINNAERRSMATVCETNTTDNTYVIGMAPTFYHLDFDIVINTSNTPTLLELQEKCLLFFREHPTLIVGTNLSLNLTEITPVGSVSKVNLSNLRQSVGRIRIEDFPVFSGDSYAGKLITSRTFELQEEGVPAGLESFTLPPPIEEPET